MSMFYLQWAGFWLSPRRFIYAFLSLCLGGFLVVAFIEAPRYRQLIQCLAAFICGIWFLAFWGIVRSTLYYRKWTTVTKYDEFYLDKNGVGFESGATSGFLGWKEFSSLWETRRYFCLEYKAQGNIPIVKKLQSAETVLAIREVLQATPVEDKYLRIPLKG